MLQLLASISPSRHKQQQKGEKESAAPPVTWPALVAYRPVQGTTLIGRICAFSAYYVQPALDPTSLQRPLPPPDTATFADHTALQSRSRQFLARSTRSRYYGTDIAPQMPQLATARSIYYSFAWPAPDSPSFYHQHFSDLRPPLATGSSCSANIHSLSCFARAAHSHGTGSV